MIKRYTKALYFSFLLFCGEEIYSQNISINTTGAANSTLSMLEVLQISATANTKGLHITHSGPVAGIGYGLWVDVTGATTKYAIVVPSGGGDVGIGTITPSSPLTVGNSLIANSYFSTYSATAENINSASTSTTASEATSVIINTPLPAANSTAYNVAQIHNARVPSGALNYGTLQGSFSVASFNGTGTLTTAYGSMGRAFNESTGTITTAVGAWNTANNLTTGTIGSAYGTLSRVNNGSGSATAAYGLWADVLNAGTVTTGYGVYIGGVAATTKYSLYASDATAPNYFAGSVGIGIAPTSQLHTTGTVRFANYPSGFLSTDASGILQTPRSIAVSGTGVAVTNGNGVAGDPTLNLSYGNVLTAPGGTTPLPDGNFGQFEAHGTYSDFNTTPNYWGWNYIVGNTNAPNASSAQWYREIVSLGSNYPGRGAGGYSLELAFPRYSHSTAGVWMRTVEGGGYTAWYRIDGGGGITMSCGTNNYLTKRASATDIACSIVYDDGTNVGIGIAPANEQLEITKNFRLPATTGATVGVIYSGANRYIHNYGGPNNFFAGVNAGNFTITGDQNTATGVYALFANTTGNRNTANGNYSLYSNTTGQANTAIGVSTIVNNTTGIFNTAIGTNALASNVAGSYATAIGANAMFFANNTATAYTNQSVALGFEALRGSTTPANNTGGQNTALGYQSLWSNTTGSANVAIGPGALYTNTTGYYNIATGFFALNKNTDGYYNTAMGVQALQNNTVGNNNIAIGNFAMNASTSGSENVISGLGALQVGTNAWYNVASGNYALSATTFGSYNTAIGHGTLASNTSGNYNTALGYNAYSTGAAWTHSMGLGANALPISADVMVRIGGVTINSIGGQVGWSTLSDARIKNKVQENVPGLSFINALRPVTYYYDVDKEIELLGSNDTSQYRSKYDIEKIQFSGFLAQEVEAAAQKVGYSFSGVDKKGTLWALRYAEFVVPLVKSVQELSIENQNLNSQISILNAQYSLLKSDYEARLKKLEALLDLPAEVSTKAGAKTEK